MKQLFPQKTQDIKGKIAVAELRRAHAIIAALSIAFSMVIGFVWAFEIQFDATLSIMAISLLTLLAGISISTAVALRKR